MAALTEREAITISIKKWEYLAKTGDNKRWIEGITTDTMPYGCALCALAGQDKVHGLGGVSRYRCRKYCPFYRKFGCCTNRSQPFYAWEDQLRNDTPEKKESRKKYAQQFLEQLKQLA
jgi:pyruvate formate-lyase activating enzyme-like uncharacterized protein